MDPAQEKIMMNRQARSKRLAIAFAFAAWVTIQTATAATNYVNSQVLPGGLKDGSTWANAYSKLEAALSGSSSGDEIWVAAGTYYPTNGTDKTATFQMVSGVDIYGGFAGTETDRSQRDPDTYKSILSGDIDQDGELD
ncbi:MAG: hypothetical protein O3A51_14240, partial [Verrucomicrobia bacterium]|nr:hypothetical protein [Verrucomicrobiota bacterium]